PDGISFDWADGAWFFRVMSAIPVEGVANLNAGITTRRLAARRGGVDEVVARDVGARGISA
ncbi:MAG: hypothetical protein ACRD68_11630, partial [Pyrinomonadaceae bacterium]